MTTIRYLLDESKQIQLANTARLIDVRGELLSAALRHEGATKTLNSDFARHQDESQAAAQNFEASIASLSSKLDQVLVEGNKVATSNSILRSLLFSELHMRYSEIRDAYPGTYAWILESRMTGFRAWLESGGGMFWISGKAGSGKSTIMKYICDSAYTAAILKSWAGSNELITANYYFWNAGYRTQMTQEGLLQSLLFQLLRKCPQLIPEAFPARWAADESFHDHPDPWGRRELSEAIEAVLAKATTLHVRFCFFIDGLDEYAGDHHELITGLTRLTTTGVVKLCVTSRPWNAFREAFENPAGLNVSHIMLHQWTRSDMQKYVRGMLREDQRFASLLARDARAPALIIEIQEKARGVFLWVFLVVRSLLRGLTERDDVPMLQQRLRALPSDLEKFFQHMLDSIEDVYTSYTARALQLVGYAIRSIPAFAFWYIDLDMEDSKFVLQSVPKPLSKREHEVCHADVVFRINKWCRDLPEVRVADRGFEDGPMLSRKVEFLHRTVRDFLQTNHPHNMLKERAGADFNPPLTLCRLLLGLAKVCSNNDIFFESAGMIMHYARDCEVQYKMTPYEVLEELNRVGNLIVSFPDRPFLHWTSQCRRPDLNFGMWDPRYSNFLTYAANFRLELYVQKAISQEPRSPEELSILLDCSLRRIYSHIELSATQYPMPALALTLLRKGASPNYEFDHLEIVTNRWDHWSLWQLFLYDCLHKTRAKSTRLWQGSRTAEAAVSEQTGRAALLLLQHGADVEARVPQPRGKGEICDDLLSPLQCLSACCHKSELEGLKLAFEHAEAAAQRPKISLLSMEQSFRNFRLQLSSKGPWELLYGSDP